ncbi:MAG: aldehyde:ferredoxin oxidoreductase [Peptococcaceae bacterium BICA1-8]|nr:MAG: aldehyde:ferredoxin oxidoreductase [Peptococcaceae bacterium BICA1-8]
MCGYAGKFLDIDLSSLSIRDLTFDEDTIKKYIGGVGIAAKLVYDLVPSDIDALEPENVLCFSVGSLVGTNVPTACRTEVSAKSPATGLFGTSNSGSFWGSELKFAGYDGVIIRGKSQEPVYVYINNNNVEILSASHVWGKDCWQTIEVLRRELEDEELQIALIGPGGENLCRFASIENGPYDAWGRTGLGAVMGSKNLKAVAVRGSNSIKVYDKKEFIKLVNQARSSLNNSPFFGPFSKFGTMLATVPYYEFGALPGRNFQTGVIDDWLETRSRKLVHQYSKRGISCMACPIACAHWVEVKEGPYKGLRIKDMEVTPLIGFAAGCDVNNIPAVAKLTEVCQRYGIDMVSAAGTIAFTMELFQRKIITEQEIGFKIDWGNEEGIFKLLEMIAKREGIGDILAEGTKAAAQIIPGAQDYAIHIKGLEIPMADPRGRWSTWTFGTLTNIRGGDHLRNRNPVENLRFNENPVPYRTEKFGLSDELYEELDIFEGEKEKIFDFQTRDVNIAAMSKWAEDLISVYNTLGVCIRPPVLQSIGPNLLSKLYTSLTGIDISAEELMEAGERIWNLQKLFNIRAGEKIEDSVFPKRFYEEEMGSGASKGRKLDRVKVQEVLDDYYEIRGWDRKTGIPREEKLKQLGLV